MCVQTIEALLSCPGSLLYEIAVEMGNNWVITRREFTTLGLVAATASPYLALAQHAALPQVGYLYFGSPASRANILDAFIQGLKEMGYVEGQNVAITYRWAGYDIESLPRLAADLVHHRVDVIATPGSQAATLAAKAVTTSIPIVFSVGGDPVAVGLVPRLNRPGGNVTGITFMGAELVGKRLSLLQLLVPTATRFASLTNPRNPSAETMVTNLVKAASSTGVRIENFQATTIDQIEAAFLSLSEKQVEALLVNPDVLFADHRERVVRLASTYKIPAIYGARAFPEVGGLMSYGDDRWDSFRQHGAYVGMILKGAKPSDLPIQQSTKFESVVNLRTAKELGLELPGTLTVDEVIE
jgi:putative ABC transport system substrate-binding protein